MTWNSGFNLKREQGLADQFMEENPLIKVELISIPKGYDDKVLTANAAENTPDGLMMWNTPMFVEAGIVEDLTPYIDSPKVVEVVKWYKDLYKMSIQTGATDAYENLGQTEFQTGIVGLMGIYLFLPGLLVFYFSIWVLWDFPLLSVFVTGIILEI